MYDNVPTKAFIRVSSGVQSWLKPKSINLRWSLSGLSYRKFCNFKSRCTTP